MSSDVKNTLFKELPVKINARICDEIERLVRGFEIRGTNSLTINSKLIGVHDFKFLPVDRDGLFEIFGYSHTDILNAQKYIKSIPKNHKVVNDTQNMFTIYVAHLLFNDRSLPEKTRIRTIENIMLYMQYRIMTSFLTRAFKYNANEGIMVKVIEDLSNKYSIKRYDTWKEVMLSRIHSVYLDKSKGLHNKCISKLDDDKKFIYAITDMRARVVDQIKVIAEVYYDYNNTNKAISNAKIDIAVDNDRLIRDRSSNISSMYDILISGTKIGIIDDNYIKLTSSLFSKVSESLLSKAITTLHITYIEQTKSHKLNKYKDTKDGKEITGMNILISDYIEGTIEILSSLDEGKTKNAVNLLSAMKSTYAAGRLSNVKLLSVKRSLVKLMRDNNISNRDATVSSLVPCIELYWLLTCMHVLR